MGRLTCAALLDTIRRSGPVLEELARYDVLGAEPVNGELTMRFTEDKRLSPEARRWLAAVGKLTARAHINVWLQVQIAVGGPKVFQPTVEQCLAMEQVAPRIPIGEYTQPFPVMIIDLPEGYRQQRTAAFASSMGMAAHGPACVIVGTHGQPPWTVWLDLVFDTGLCVQWGLSPCHMTIEDGIAHGFGPESYPPADIPAGPFGHDECMVLAGLIRLAVNAMLLLSDFGCKHFGPENASHHRRLERYAALARQRGRGMADAQRNLRMSAQLYGFPQDIVLYGEERGGAAADGGEGGGAEAHRRPHWRRGHWKTHAHGPGLSRRKRLFVKPVLVNGHRLREGDGIPRTTYWAPGDPEGPKS